MATLRQRFLIRARRSGISPGVLMLAAIGIVGISVGISGLEGLLFTLAIGLAYLLGTATREGPFHLRSLATNPPGRPVTPDLIKARIAADTQVAHGQGQSLCVALAIDGYDELAHQHGIRALNLINTQLGEHLLSEVRHSDLLADMGDGQFSVYLPPNPRIDLESAVQTALRLQTAGARRIMVDGLKVHLTTSIGFCINTRLPTDPGAPDLFTAAQTALRTAQKDGPRAIRAFDRCMLHRPTPKNGVGDGKLDVLSGINAGQIEPWFQPQVCADTGALTGVEALARWRHPEHGLLAPGQFLDAAHAQGMMVKLTETILHQSVEQLWHWDSAGIHIPRVSINLGAQDLADPTLVDRISWALDRHGLPPARLGVEVLETVVAKADPDDMVARNLLALGKLGCLIDLDDFGTGSASINGIRRFGVNRIKIDRSLVTAVDTDKDQHAMIAAILTMAAQLHVDVLAEGVETSGEHSALAQLGCAHVQGYAIARAMPSADLLTWALRRGETQPPMISSGIEPDVRQSLRRKASAKGFGGKTA
ncbi:GGDEF domain-containing phosphodiesterase [Oceaniglobus ichthyenteri]|uniref:GGDEF domain-containing phosphodiesterase n=1 Tax=Oceaniglobus ichthyenteri TaxID=2136177 RepID=UPI000D3CE1A2|nr:GGDEF domain-containing phosphodiesterase [Oceaniglobus ichthyenteri]